jgi:hypothetical protein
VNELKDYLINSICNNCKVESAINVPFGQLADMHVKSLKCKVCGCATIHARPQNIKLNNQQDI